jgi:hypothetical protein
MLNRLAMFLTVLLASVAWGQTQSSGTSSPPSGEDSMPGMNMPMGDKADSDVSAHVVHSMEGRMDMGPHMKMTALRQARPGDAARAQLVVEAARKAAEKYRDYHTALADGFQIFLPQVPQKIYHFTNYPYAREASWHFNPEHPTSLLYEKQGNGYKLIGVMYTAPRRLTEDQLDERIPLSVAQWHEHVNLCRPPANMSAPEKMDQLLGPNAQFGLKGSIHTEPACEAAGGTFLPVIFNWMVHVYPFEKDQAAIWSVERQHGDAD